VSAVKKSQHQKSTEDISVHQVVVQVQFRLTPHDRYSLSAHSLYIAENRVLLDPNTSAILDLLNITLFKNSEIFPRINNSTVIQHITTS
jgi:hypothetical protein